MRDALIDLLLYVDGTYWRKYEDDEITFFILGSDVDEYPYYLLSSEEIIENQNQAKEERVQKKRLRLQKRNCQKSENNFASEKVEIGLLFGQPNTEMCHEKKNKKNRNIHPVYDLKLKNF